MTRYRTTEERFERESRWVRRFVVAGLVLVGFGVGVLAFVGSANALCPPKTPYFVPGTHDNGGYDYRSSPLLGRRGEFVGSGRSRIAPGDGAPAPRTVIWLVLSGAQLRGSGWRRTLSLPHVNCGTRLGCKGRCQNLAPLDPAYRIDSTVNSGPSDATDALGPDTGGVLPCV